MQPIECNQWKRNRLFKNLLKNGYHLINWRQGIKAVLPKPNKPKDIPKGYWIITLLNDLRKVSEKILANRLSHIALKILDLGQIGGIKNRSAIDAVLGLIHDIQFAEHQKWKITAMFFDIKGAFDFVSLKQLLETIEELGLPAYIIKWGWWRNGSVHWCPDWVRDINQKLAERTQKTRL